MLIPLSWLSEYIDIPVGTTAEEIAETLTRIGFEEEEVKHFGADLEGPLVVGKVLEFVEEPQANGKTIRWCQVEVAPGEVTGIVCGASNFLVNDKVVVVRPGATLPGGFQISARKTYGHVSDGMICSARELQFSDEHNGIIRLIELGLDPEVGTDAIALLGLKDSVIDVSVLPDRGYALSIRGIARELAAATGWAWRDPADFAASITPSAQAFNGEIADPSVCSRLVLRTLQNFNSAATSPAWMQRRLALAGMRSISLAVDVTNYVMIELGQPLHAYDKAKLAGAIRVERAGKYTQIKTLDDVDRKLNPEDVLILDESGPIGLAGVMGGLNTEMDSNSTEIVIEAARFNPGDIAKASRRHKLSSEASRRFERGVDPALAPIASARASALLQEFGGATEVGAIDLDLHTSSPSIAFSADIANKYLGTDFTEAEVVSALTAVGCEITGLTALTVQVPSWRSDLKHQVDLIEEVARVLGYDRIPSALPPTNAGMGYNPTQAFRRRAGRLLAERGLVEVLSYPFIGEVDFAALELAEDDPRRETMKIANPLNAEIPGMRSTLLGPLLNTAKRNAGRGHQNIAIFEMGKVVLTDGVVQVAPQPSIESRPKDSELAEIYAAVPVQPTYLGAVLSGEIEVGQPSLQSSSTWDWQNTIALVGEIMQAANVKWIPTQIQIAPWHPGRTAGIAVNGNLIGFAGELHPKVCTNYGLPARTCAFEFDLDALAEFGLDTVIATPVRTMPKANLDFAFVVDANLPALAVSEVIGAAAPELIETNRVFDIYSGEQVPAGKKSVAVAISLRTVDRTLSESDLAEIRAGIIAEVESKLGATLR